MLSPPGTDQPEVFIWGMISVSDFAAAACAGPVAATDPNYVTHFLLCQFTAMSRQWKATDAVPVIATVLGGLGITAQVISNGGQSNMDAQASVRTSSNGKQQDQLWMVSMLYSLNASFSAVAYYYGVRNPTEWDSFGFTSACAADPGKLAATERECVAVLRSFRPGASWLRSTIQGYLDNMQHQVQQAGQTFSQVAQMEAQQQLRGMATNQRVYRGWWNVLGGSIDLIAPNGDVYNTDNTNRYYCLTPGSSLMGTDNPAVLQGTACQTTLTPINPPG